MTRLLQLCEDRQAPAHPDLTPVVPADLAAEGERDPAIWFVDGTAAGDPLPLMAAVRRQAAPAAYLQPIVLLTSDGGSRSLAAQAADATVSAAALAPEEWRTRFSPLQRWIEQLPDASAADAQLSVRVLRHLASRDSDAEPVMTATQAAGFVYPPLLPYFGGDGTGTLELLQFLASQGFLESEFRASTHRCFHCRSAFLAFEETCEQCKSADLKVQELVHHFRCGHVAPLAEYRDGDRLGCGKCGRELRHIGVDYDKPSLVYHCRSCDHRFQDAEVRTTCFACARQAPPENQLRETISRFAVTPLGDNAARFGIESLFTHLLERDIGLVPWSVFERFVSVEQSRIRRFGKSRSSLVLLRIDDMELIYATLGARAVELFEELAGIVAGIVRDTDVATSREERFFLFLLSETDLDNAEVPRARLVERLREVLGANLPTAPELDSRVLAVSDDLDLERELQRMAVGDGA